MSSERQRRRSWAGTVPTADTRRFKLTWYLRFGVVAQSARSSDRSSNARGLWQQHSAASCCSDIFSRCFYMTGAGCLDTFSAVILVAICTLLAAMWLPKAFSCYIRLMRTCSKWERQHPVLTVWLRRIPTVSRDSSKRSVRRVECLVLPARQLYRRHDPCWPRCALRCAVSRACARARCLLQPRCAAAVGADPPSARSL